MVGTPVSFTVAVTPSTTVPAGAVSNPLCWPVAQSTDTKAPAGKVGGASDGAALSEAAGASEAVATALAEFSGTRASV